MFLEFKDELIIKTDTIPGNLLIRNYIFGVRIIEIFTPDIRSF